MQPFTLCKRNLTSLFYFVFNYFLLRFVIYSSVLCDFFIFRNMLRIVLLINNNNQLNLDDLFQDVTNEPSDCKYYNFNVSNDLQTKNEDLLLLSMNIASLNKNQFKLENLISQAPKSPDIIAVTETKIRNANNISNAYNIDNYEFIHNDTPTHFGGVGFYINEKLEFKTRRDLELNIQSCEDMWIEVETKNKKNTVFGVIYRHPKHNLNEFRDKFAQTLEKITNENKKNVHIRRLQYKLTQCREKRSN